MMHWLIETAKAEGTAAYGIVVVALVLFTGAIIGEFFGGIGDKLFAKKEKKPFKLKD
jgi:hypothetical protein